MREHGVLPVASVSKQDADVQVVAALLQAHHYEIWTDVYGMFR